MAQPLISVIIPCYNCEAFLDETLQGLTKQTFKNFEVVCVNDGSKDGTAKKLEEWKENKQLCIQVVHQENGGVSRARNVGMQVARGKFLLFLDADDMYHNTFIQRLWEATTQNKADIAYCWTGRDVDVLKKDYQSARVVCQNQEDAMRNLMYRMADVAFCCYLYRKDWIDQQNLTFDVATRFFEDREFNWKYLCHCKSAVLIDAPLYYYRVNLDSATRKAELQWRTDGLDAIKRIETYMEQLKCSFLEEFKSYLFARVIWGKAMRYAVGKRKDLFQKLCAEYDLRSCMKQTAKDRNKLVALASWFYLIHPSLFYYIVRLKK